MCARGFVRVTRSGFEAHLSLGGKKLGFVVPEEHGFGPLLDFFFDVVRDVDALFLEGWVVEEVLWAGVAEVESFFV